MAQRNLYSNRSSTRIIPDSNNHPRRRQPTIGYSSLRLAVAHGDLLLVRVILSSPHLPLGWDDGYDCLTLALESHHPEIALALLQRVTRVNPASPKRTSPLHLASRDSSVDLVEALLSKGASIDALDENLMTPVHHAVVFENLAVVELLLSRGAEVFKIKDAYFEFSAFEHACDSGNRDVLGLFLDEGCDPSARFSHQGRPSSPLRMALARGNASSVRMLLKRGAREVGGDGEEGLLQLACKGEEPLEMVRMLLESGTGFLEEVNGRNAAGFTPLRIAVKGAKLELVGLLLERGADPGVEDREGKVVLQLAVEDRLWHVVDRLLSHHRSSEDRTRGEQAFKMAVLEHGVTGEAYKTFAKHGYILKPQHLAEITFAAIERGYFQTVEAMLRLEKESEKRDQQPATRLMNAKNPDGMSLEHCAAKFKRLDILRLLTREDGGRSAFSLDERGNSALSYAIENKDEAVIRILMADKSKRYSMSLLGALDDPPLLKLLLNLGADVNHRLPVSGATALHSACQLRPSDRSLIQLLLLHGADVNAATCDGSSSLHLAICSSKSRETSPQLLHTLLSHGARVNARDRLGRTPLHLAAASSCDSVSALLRYSPDLNARAADGSTGLSVALDASRDGRGSKASEVLVREVVKLRVAKLAVSESNWRLVRELGERREFRMECAEELERMRRVRVGARVTLVDVLRRKSRRLERCLRRPDREVRRRLEDGKMGEEFPLYGSLLRGSAEAILKDLMVDEARRALARLTSCELPDLCWERINRDLGDSDLRNLHAAAICLR